MNTGLLIAIIGTLAIVVLAIAIMLGKLDMAMIDYYFCSPEKRARYNVQRLRILTGGALILVVALDWALPFLFKVQDSTNLISLIIVVALYTLLERTWARRK